jgi:uncharacterized alkaline shock family protein YloU
MPDKPTPGKTTIAPEVLLSVARLTALTVDGVAGLSAYPGSLNMLLKRNVHVLDGVRVKLVEGVVTVDLYIMLEDGVNFRQISREVQGEVSRAIREMVGLSVGQINVHIEDISFAE